MKTSFKARLTRTIAILILGFILLFVFRFIYGYTTGLTETQEEDFSNFFNENESLKRNYASDNYKILKRALVNGVIAQPHEFDVNQKYEKTATIKTRTKQFEKDEEGVRSTIKKYSGIIQYEQNAGRTG